MVLTARDKLFGGFAVLLAGTVLALIAHGCGSTGLRLSQASGFSHEPHLERGVPCESCHRASEGDRAGMPTWGTCHVCHGANPRRESYPFELEIQRYDSSTPFIAEPTAAFDLHAAHETHERAGVPCSACHGDTGEPSLGAVDAKRCNDCHAERSAPRECATCHQRLRKDVPPPSHAGTGWMQVHGQEARMGHVSGHGNLCELCHAETDCMDCHRVTPPATHTEFFRQRGHGLVALIDREECSTCHQEHFCLACHREERPRSHHRAGWGGMTSIHCLSCHEPGGQSACEVCHDQSPSHLFATPIPPPPHPSRASDCYRCHLRPPHADNGMACTICHR